MSISLNPEQQRAAEHVEGPLLVLAGAGSGKTRIVTARIAHLLKLGVPSNEILAVTFTNKAAEELQRRIRGLAHASVLACTFHSLGARILRESVSSLGYTQDFTIYDEEDAEKLFKECLTALHFKLEKGEAKLLRSEISHAKNSLIPPENYSDPMSLAARLYPLYQERLKEYNALDFDDLLFLSVRLFQKHQDVLSLFQNRWSFLLIDEYQDTNHAQYLLAKLLAERHHNLFAVGDPDQSIYSWRGADLSNILNFEKDYPGAKVITLEQNYRSRNRILQAANHLIHHNSSRYQKNLWSERGEGEKIGLFLCRTEREETEFVFERLRDHHQKEGIAYKDSVIFYRTNFQSRVFEDGLLRHKIPYVIIGGLSFYQRREIKDILSILRMVLGGADFLSFSRTVNLPRRGIGETCLRKLQDLANSHGLPILTLCLEIASGRLASPLTQRQRQGIENYVQMIEEIKKRIRSRLPLHQIIQEAIALFRYEEVLKEDPETMADRRANLDELVTKAAEWEEEKEEPTLVAFLEELTLRTSGDEVSAGDEAVRLMTLHNGKGLEFSLVFIVGMEEDLFPHINAKENPASLEEERRLCYVGMTRAKERLYLTASKARFLFGASRTMQPSRFLFEIPKSLLQTCTLSQEEKEHPENEELSPGDAVRHRDFGKGVILKAYPTSLGPTYDVSFTDAGVTRTLVAKFAKLRQIGKKE